MDTFPSGPGTSRQNIAIELVEPTSPGPFPAILLLHVPTGKLVRSVREVPAVREYREVPVFHQVHERSAEQVLSAGIRAESSSTM